MSSVVKLLFPIYLKILETRGTRDKEWKTQRRVDYLCQISQTELWQRVANFPDQNLAPEEAFAQIAKKEPYTMLKLIYLLKPIVDFHLYIKTVYKNSILI